MVPLELRIRPLGRVPERRVKALGAAPAVVVRAKV